METLTRTQYHDSEVSKKTDFENASLFPVKLLQTYIDGSSRDCGRRTVSNLYRRAHGGVLR
jgi:hypothetical protein